MIRGQKLVNYVGTQVALFPMESMKVSQAPFENYSHQGTMNIDLAGKDGGIENIFAPVDVTVAENNSTSYHKVIFWSDNKALWADGTIDFFSILVLHDNDVSDLPVGKKIKQGEIMYQEGNTGYGSTGNHVHLCLAKGHTTKVVQRSTGERDLDGRVMPNDVFFINDTVILKDGGLVWKTYVAPPVATMMDDVGRTYIATDGVWVRELPTVNSSKLILLPKNTLVDVMQASTTMQDGYNWVKVSYKTKTGYCAVVQEATVKDKVVVTPIPVVEPTKVGDKVWIKREATNYSTGQTISTHYKKGGIYAYVPYTIMQDGATSSRKSNKDYWLLSRINSWVKKVDVEKL